MRAFRWEALLVVLMRLFFTAESQSTDAPSSMPSEVPSTFPSVSPSELPSETPSAAPTNLPSTSPSVKPSQLPSGVPSSQPTPVPSAEPSLSNKPSVAPTSSEAPSALPSVSPSELASEQPTSIPSAAPSLTRKPCVFFAVVMDETFSMGIEQQTISSIMEGLDSYLMDDFFVFICTFGFGGSSGSNVNNGCSLGFDGSDFRFEQTGSMEDGWEAILFADDFFSNQESIDGILFDPQCTSTQKLMYLITDEDRDVKASLSLYNVTDVLSYGGWTLTSVLNVQLNGVVGAKFNGDDSFTLFPAAGDSVVDSSNSPILSGFGSTIADYVPLVKSTAGSLWGINIIRRGGKAAEALVQSFLYDVMYRIIGD